MKTDVHSIRHWDMSHRTVVYHYHDQADILAVIVGMSICPEDSFKAQLVILDDQYAGYGATSMSWIKEGNKKATYSFVNEHPDVPALRKGMQAKKDALKKAAAAKEALEKQEDDDSDPFGGEPEGFDTVDQEPIRDPKALAAKNPGLRRSVNQPR